MDQDQLHILLQKYLDGTATPEETTALHDWYRSAGAAEVEWPVDGPNELDTVRERMLDRLRREAFGETALRPTPVRRLRPAIYAAAAVLILALAGAAYLRSNHLPPPIAHDALPGGNKATLILGSGQSITLDSTHQGLLTMQNGVSVNQTKGNLTYSGQTDGAATPYNTILTPNGGTYAVTLSDGTKVWLNAASSLKYPVKFTGGTRSVDLTGEAYFEVTHNSAPFTVHCLGQTIDVLGTDFNVNAYTNESSIKTTLLEGKVDINGATTLRPGEQSSVGGDGKIRITKGVDTAEVMAWKNGMFQFDEADIGTVMRQIGRWYDVDVVYEGKLPDDHFRGKIPRNVNASQVLQILAIGGIDFTIEGKKIYLK